jgi:hypothetical protein
VERIKSDAKSLFRVALLTLWDMRMRTEADLTAAG